MTFTPNQWWLKPPSETDPITCEGCGRGFGGADVYSTGPYESATPGKRWDWLCEDCGDADKRVTLSA